MRKPGRGGAEGGDSRVEIGCPLNRPEAPLNGMCNESPPLLLLTFILPPGQEMFCGDTGPIGAV